jgi:hypothetical protein
LRFAVCGLRFGVWGLGLGFRVGSRCGVPRQGGLGKPESTYRSEDGATWDQVTSSAPWAAREGHALVDGQVGGERRLLLLAGRTVASSAMTYLSDVWSSLDGGVQWQQVRLWKREGSDREVGGGECLEVGMLLIFSGIV